MRLAQLVQLPNNDSDGVKINQVVVCLTSLNLRSSIFSYIILASLENFLRMPGFARLPVFTTIARILALSIIAWQAGIVASEF
jgi:hypothetical protein